MKTVSAKALGERKGPGKGGEGGRGMCLSEFGKMCCYQRSRGNLENRS